MTYRKLSRAIAVVALGAAALIAFPASATAQPVDEAGNLADLCSGAGRWLHRDGEPVSDLGSWGFR
jgi:hypothetical protein